MKGCFAFPQSPALLTIRLFSVISRTLVGGGSYPTAEKLSVYSTAPADWTRSVCELFFWYHLKLCHTITFNVLCVGKSDFFIWIFYFGKKSQKARCIDYEKCYTCTILCFAPHQINQISWMALKSFSNWYWLHQTLYRQWSKHCYLRAIHRVAQTTCFFVFLVFS